MAVRSWYVQLFRKNHWPTNFSVQQSTVRVAQREPMKTETKKKNNSTNRVVASLLINCIKYTKYHILIYPSEGYFY
jgi:hypothetical protein